RVDMRGSGESDGVLYDEYLKQEQDDALEVIAWIAKQTWCTGKVGMMGISWGGFNGLQVAARRPPALKAIVTVASTDDRYADDVHYMGGCLNNSNMGWGSTMFANSARPPDPAVVGDAWRTMWQDRLDNATLLVHAWLRHQRRDAYWKHGSVCENFGDITCAVYAIGGWEDGYSNAVPRLLAGLNCPKKGLIGPWPHSYPHIAKLHPMGFLQEILRWWDEWLKDQNTGIMAEPMYRVWLQESVAPQPGYTARPGRWVCEPAWPSPTIKPRLWHLGHNTLNASVPAEVRAPHQSNQNVGLGAGTWCPYGFVGEMPIDQRAEDGQSLCFDSAPLTERLEILGAPVVTLAIESDRPQAIIAVRLCEVHANGESLRVSYGLLNLTHRDSHEQPSALVLGRRYAVRVQLNDVAHCFAAGSRIRVAISTSYWPIAWPAPEPVTITIHGGQGSRLELPVRPPRPEDAKLAEFPPAQKAPLQGVKVLRPGHRRMHLEYDLSTETSAWINLTDRGRVEFTGHGLCVEASSTGRYAISRGDPLSARIDIKWLNLHERGNWRTRVESQTSMTASTAEFHIVCRLEAFEGDRLFARRDWDVKVARDLV
ncbi:MAG: CocE/NonD family hydrolase, partial [Alphaproteobacteria bacterium]|nr:CocE/NonD family hydrolase [Alphaproteobacteria bacterium]